jgi:hypothetical protein
VKGEGGPGAWKLKPLPTIVLVYDPSKKDHIKAAFDAENNKEFKIAASYFNLVRIDSRTITNKRSVAELGGVPTFYIYRATAERVAVVKAPEDGQVLVKALDPVFEQDFGVPASNAISAMGTVLARKSWIDDEIRRHEAVVICPDCGKKNITVQERLAELRKELGELKAREGQFATVRPGVLVSKAK